MVSLISPKGPLVTMLLCPTTLLSSNNNPLPWLSYLPLALIPSSQSIVCFIHTWICSGDATSCPFGCLKIKINSFMIINLILLIDNLYLLIKWRRRNWTGLKRKYLNGLKVIEDMIKILYG